MNRAPMLVAAMAAFTLAACHSAPAEPQLASTQVHLVLDKTPT